MEILARTETSERFANFLRDCAGDFQPDSLVLNGRRFLFCRKRDANVGPFADAGFDLDGAAMRFNDASYNRQTKP